MTRVGKAIEEITAAGWTADCPMRLVGGPDEYLFGEETALLEVVDGRAPLPRIAPPWRRGVVEVVDAAVDQGRESGLAARVDMAGPTTDAPPALVSNVETFANVARVTAHGDEWLRAMGTTRSPGSVVCTVSGSTVQAGVGEVPLGTTLADAIAEIGGGMAPNRQVKAVLSGVSTGVMTGDQLATPLTYEDMAAAGGGLGSAGLMVFDETVDMLAVAAGAAHFLAVESCGQCTPCKNDGKSIAEALARLCRNEGDEGDLADVRDRLKTVADGARCSLASQQQIVIGSILARFENELADHLEGRVDPVEPMLIAPLVAIHDGEVTIDERFRTKQPDWTYDATDSGQSPTDRLTDHTESLPESAN
jgi:NADH:ubiquinone oxidoreductase subunit F (NADH-binding)